MTLIALSDSLNRRANAGSHRGAHWIGSVGALCWRLVIGAKGTTLEFIEQDVFVHTSSASTG